MKLDKEPRLGQFLKSPAPEFRAALIYGPDEGLVHERAATLGKAIVPDLSDPFNVADLSADALVKDPARLLDELAAQSLMGGRRLVRVQDAADTLAPALQELLANPPLGDNFLLLEAGELRTTSPLRKLFDSAPNAALIPCYEVSAADLAKWCAGELKAAGVTISADGLQQLATSLASDRGMARQEVEKLITYAGPTKRLELADILALTGDSADAVLDAPAMAAADGDLKALDKALAHLFVEGTSPTPVLRAAQRHFTRLYEVLSSGEPVMAALDNLRPPLFWKDKDRFRSQADKWTTPKVEEALSRLLTAEVDCKKTGLRDVTVCSRTLMGIAALVARRSA